MPRNIRNQRYPASTSFSFDSVAGPLHPRLDLEDFVLDTLRRHRSHHRHLLVERLLERHLRRTDQLQPQHVHASSQPNHIVFDCGSVSVASLIALRGYCNDYASAIVCRTSIASCDYGSARRLRRDGHLHAKPRNSFIPNAKVVFVPAALGALGGTTQPRSPPARRTVWHRARRSAVDLPTSRLLVRHDGRRAGRGSMHSRRPATAAAARTRRASAAVARARRTTAAVTRTRHAAAAVVRPRRATAAVARARGAASTVAHACRTTAGAACSRTAAALAACRAISPAHSRIAAALDTCRATDAAARARCAAAAVARPRRSAAAVTRNRGTATAVARACRATASTARRRTTFAQTDARANARARRAINAVCHADTRTAAGARFSVLR